MTWLTGALAGQPRPAAEMEALALAAGFKHTTLADARKRLGIQAKRRAGAWWWYPPKARRKKQPVTV